jgi:hypothetical protein
MWLATINLARNPVMRKLLLLLAALGCVAAAVVLSDAQTDRPAAGGPDGARFVVTKEGKNPWTSLAPNVAAGQFQFVVVSDRTGGHRRGVFSTAVQQVNLLQPEFVMSVGDLIEGAKDEAANRTQWEEFDRYARQFEMPFFYCVGNHDGNNRPKANVWRERLGRAYYHFTYQDCLFLVLNSNDPPPPAAGQAEGPTTGISADQRAYLEKALRENDQARWTFVFLHHPVWTARDLAENGWQQVEKLLAGRRHHVFCGHVHVFRKYLRNGTSYYQLATTGGGSAMRGVDYGEFDQVAWVTMKKHGPVIAHIGLDGVLKDDLAAFVSTEDGDPPRRMEGLHEAAGTVTLDGKPAAGWRVQFTEPGAGPMGRGNQPPGGAGLVAADGTFKVYQHRGPAGLKAGKYVVTFGPAPGLVVAERPPANPVPERYRYPTTTPYVGVEVKPDVRNKFEFRLTTE